ncbi:FecR domain-containing protein [Herbaspirillum sp. WKF16]|jgi:hypothetical protein|uniref:FecR family protein n=1 Tax=Herbaspirillum sp. WKF16 TaxID=3028312 RepID=UPI0023A9706E|nr:FecR domain-containing protein [Herbaspirillum sp. WKF16]WDZ96444.1 FecR domain-containing protein [Herbaspirillum sp. WKF16]
MKSLKKNHWTHAGRSLAMLCMALAMLAAAGAANAQSKVVGTVTHLSGLLTARHADGTRNALAVKSEILQGDTLITERETFTRVKFMDNAEMVLRPGTEVVVSKYVYEQDKPENDSVAIGLVKGGLRAVTGLVGKRNHDAVNFDTPTATIGIRGTNFGALFCQNDCGGVPTPSGSAPPNGLHVDVSQGAVILTNPGGAQVFQAGQFGFVANLNTAPLIVPPTQGVPVTMPQSISKNAPASGGASKASAVDCIVQ